MKSVTIKILALLLAVLLTLPLMVACGDTNEPTETTGGAVIEGTDEKAPAVAKNNYDTEFTVLYCADIFQKGYFFVEEDERQPGNDMDDKVYERALAVEEYLGVDIIAENGGGYREYTGPLKTAISSGDDTYQMIMTHAYFEVSNLITSNYFRDFQEFDSLQLTEDYWKLQVMEDLAINDTMYCGYNDFCLANCFVIGFNKAMVEEYSNTIGDLYQQVRDKEWTIEKLIEYSSLVSRDNGDGKWDELDTYGFAGYAWVPMVSFQHAADIPIIKADADGDLYLSPMQDNRDKITKLDEMLYDFYHAESTYAWAPPDLGDMSAWSTRVNLELDSNRVMFATVNNYQLVTTKEDVVKVGVLPYPKWDKQQAEYKTLSWNGVLGIPTTVKDDEMVGDVIEMLAWYSEPVCTAFYETLLGSKVADAPEDVEMLNIVWAGQVSDAGLVYSSCTDKLDGILYALAHHTSINNKPAYATLFEENRQSVERQLNRLFN